MSGPPLLFDLDGTLLDTLGDLAAAANAARAMFGLDPVPDAAVAPHIGWGLGHLLSHVLPASNHAEMEAARATFMAHYGTHLLVHSVPFPGAEKLMRRRGARFVGLVTNKPSRFVAPILAGLGWHFDVVIAGDTLPQRKPDPAPLLAAIDGLPDGQRAIYIGDTEVDREAATGAGLCFVGVAWGRIAKTETRVIHRLDAALSLGECGPC